MKEQILIPNKIKVGFNLREDTYTKKLAYIIYHDGKQWRKEKSWDSWRLNYMDDNTYETKKREMYDSTIKTQKEKYKFIVNQLSDKKNNYDYYERYRNTTEEEYLNDVVGPYEKFKPYLRNVSNDKSIIPIEYDNLPLEGFVLNKKVGGDNYSWNPRQTYCRVYDPRGFEFEITIPNLLYILENTNSIKGKGLEGKFIYGWDGLNLVLVPESAPEYQKMITYTSNLNINIKKKDLEVGVTYFNKNLENITFLKEDYIYDHRGVLGEKVLWFYNIKKLKVETLKITDVKQKIDIDNNVAAWFDELEKCESYKPKVKRKIVYESIVIEPPTTRNYPFYMNNIYVKKGNKYKIIEIQVIPTTSLFQKTHLKYRVENDIFDSFKELISKYSLYEQKLKDE